MKLSLRVLSGILFVCALNVTPSAAQSRVEVGLRGSPRVGWGPSARHNYRMGRYSTGLGDLRVRYRPAEGGALGSSIYGAQSMNIRSRGVGGTAGAQPSTPQVGGSRRYASSSMLVPRVGAPIQYSPGAIGGYSPGTIGLSGRDYAAAAAAHQKKIPDDLKKEILTSLVPRQAAKHKQAMQNGEDAFRKGAYTEAWSHFEKARKLSQDSPESLLSLARVSFALADGSYSKAAEYLRMTVDIVPELADLTIFPRSFYGNQDEYLKHLKKLEDHVSSGPDDGDAQFVIGYMRWRQGKPDEARKALNLASRHTPRLTRAVKALLDGINVEKTTLVEPPKMAKAVDYSWAGIRIAIPEGFINRTLDKPRHVLIADSSKDAEPLTVAVGTLAVGSDVTAAAVQNYIMNKWAASPGVSNLTLVEEREITVASLQGVGRLIKYKIDGAEAAAVALAVVRDVKRPDGAAPIRIAYGLLVRSTRKNMTPMIGVINGVAKSAEFTEVSRGVDLPIELTDNTIQDEKGLYAMRIPKGWASSRDKTGISMGQMDHLLGGATSPSLRVVTLNVGADKTAKVCGESLIDYAIKKRARKIEILSQGPAKVGSVDGYQFVMRKQVLLEKDQSGQDKYSEPFTEIGALVAAPAGPGQKRYHVIVLTCYDCDPKKAESLMEKIVSGFTMLSGKASAAKATPSAGP